MDESREKKLQFDLEKEVHTLETFLEFSRAMSEAKTLKQVYSMIMLTCMGHKGILVTALFLADREQTGLFTVKALRGLDQGKKTPSIQLSPQSMEALIQEKVLYVDKVDEQELQSTRDYLKSICCRLVVPIFYQHQIKGLLICGTKISGKSYTQEDIDLLHSVNSHAGVTINNIQVVETLKNNKIQLEKKIFQLEAIDEINRSMSTTFEMDEMCRALLLVTGGYLSAETGIVFIQSSSNPEHFLRRAQTGIKSQGLPTDIVVQNTDIPYFFEEASHTKVESHSFQTVYGMINARLCLPIGTPENLTGFCLFGPKVTEQAYRSKDIKLAGILVRQAFAFIRNRLFYNQMRENYRDLQFANQKILKEMKERKAAESQAVHHARRLSQILTTANEGFVEIDHEALVTDINQMMCEILARPRKDIIGRSLYSFIHPDDYPVLQQELESRRKGIKSVYELRMTNPDGDIVQVLVKAAPLTGKTTNDQRIVGSFAMITDITERKAFENQLREYERIVSASHDIMLWVNPQFEIRICNDACLRSFDTGEHTVLGRPLAELIGNSLFDFFHPRLQQCLNKQDIHFQKWIDFPNGKYHMDIAFHPVQEITGGISGVIIIMHDVTSLKKLEARLMQSQKLEAVGTLAGGIAHDFNNILSCVIGLAQLIQQLTEPNSKTGQYSSEIISAGNRGADIVRQILTFSRRSEQEFKPVHIHVIVKEVLKLMRSVVPAGIEIQQSIETSDHQVMADPTQIHQVLINLITNAFHAMEKKNGVLTIQLNLVAVDSKEKGKNDGLTSGRWIKLVVKDTGVGMDNEVANRIFEPFFTTKAKDKGTGMGLAVTHGIVRSHNGTITVESSPGKGTSFAVFLPVISQKKEILDLKEDEIPLGNFEKILFVDDEEFLVVMVKEMMATLQYEATAVQSGEKALEIFESNPQAYDLVMTDYDMPKMSGLELIEKIHKIRPDMPALMFSGYLSQFTVDRLKTLGLENYVMKPLDFRQMACHIRAALKDRKAPV